VFELRQPSAPECPGGTVIVRARGLLGSESAARRVVQRPSLSGRPGEQCSLSESLAVAHGPCRTGPDSSVFWPSIAGPGPGEIVNQPEPCCIPAAARTMAFLGAGAGHGHCPRATLTANNLSDPDFQF